MGMGSNGLEIINSPVLQTFRLKEDPWKSREVFGAHTKESRIRMGSHRRQRLKRSYERKQTPKTDDPKARTHIEGD